METTSYKGSHCGCCGPHQSTIAVFRAAQTSHTKGENHPECDLTALTNTGSKVHQEYHAEKRKKNVTERKNHVVATNKNAHEHGIPEIWVFLNSTLNITIFAFNAKLFKNVCV